MPGSHEACQCRSGGAGDSSIPRRIGARKAARMYGAVANSTALIASMRRWRPNFRVPTFRRPRPEHSPAGDVDQSTPRARKSCGCGGGSFNHILHLNKTGRLELAREGHRLRRATCRAAIDHRSRARMGLRRVRGSERILTRQLELSRPLQGAFRPKSLANHR